jgi:hypothetical protein
MILGQYTHSSQFIRQFFCANFSVFDFAKTQKIINNRVPELESCSGHQLLELPNFDPTISIDRKEVQFFLINFFLVFVCIRFELFAN